MSKQSAMAAGLRRLFNRLYAYEVKVWGLSSTTPDLIHDRDIADLSKAHVVSSLRREDNRHALVIDIDHPSWLVESSTPGHFHLYVDVPGGIGKDEYFALLMALANAGVIEPGYAGASAARGHSDVRLPWIKKESA